MEKYVKCADLKKEQDEILKFSKNENLLHFMFGVVVSSLKSKEYTEKYINERIKELYSL